MDISIEQSCPSCGASILMREDDRLIRCEYCDVSNYRAESVVRYALPARAKQEFAPEDLVYIPYLRLKGTVLTIASSGVTHKILDTTCSAVKGTALPISLGLKPQALNVSPVVGSTPGLFSAQQIPAKEIFTHALKVTDLFATKKQKSNILQRFFVGETISKIYQPYVSLHGKVFDAVNGSVVGTSGLLEEYVRVAGTSKTEWEPRFISTLCPDCGGLLKGERDSLVIQCSNCEKHWYEKNGLFNGVASMVTESVDSDSLYLPFWELILGSQGELKSYGDYLDFTNQPIVALQRYYKEPLKMLIPAFKVNPKAFLQLAAQMTMSQVKMSDFQRSSGREMLDSVMLGSRKRYPVTLGMSEAVQSVKAVIAKTTIDKKRSLPKIKTLKLSIADVRLHYFPFTRMTHDLVQEQTRATVTSAALKYGRKL